MDIEVRRTTYLRNFRSGWHRSQFAQLIYPSRGTMTLHTRAGTWIVPPLRACWLPALEEHDVEAPSGLDMHSVYCTGPGVQRLPPVGGIVPVSLLLRATILALETAAADSRRRLRNLSAVFQDEIRLYPTIMLHLPALQSERLSRIQSALRRDPADNRTLDEWARLLGVATRTLARIFQRDARMTFVQYRSQVRLHSAIASLAMGQSVTSTAHDFGFGSASNFIAMFKKATGRTPRAYFSALEAPEILACTGVAI